MSFQDLSLLMKVARFCEHILFPGSACPVEGLGQSGACRRRPVADFTFAICARPSLSHVGRSHVGGRQRNSPKADLIGHSV